MWQWLWILGTTASLATPPTAIGPSAPGEAKILWEDGRKAFDDGRFRDAANLLERLVSRHPSAEGATEAHRLLGVSHLELGETTRAIEPLKHFADARERLPEGQRARLLLVQAYLGLNKADEAFLIADSVVKACRKRPEGFPADLRTSAQLWKAQSLIRLNKDREARLVLDAAKKETPPSTELTGHAGWVELQLRTRACARWPSREKLDEAQVREQLQKRGDCLLETTLPFRDVIASGRSDWSDLAYAALEHAHASYQSSCLSPPLPPGKRSKRELERYRQELVPVLRRECSRKSLQAIELIEPAKEKLPPASIPYINRMVVRLKELARAP